MRCIYSSLGGHQFNESSCTVYERSNGGEGLINVIDTRRIETTAIPAAGTVQRHKARALACSSSLVIMGSEKRRVTLAGSSCKRDEVRRVRGTSTGDKYVGQGRLRDMTSRSGRTNLITVGVIAMILGGVWAGQGLNLIPGSFMTGSGMWLYIGLILAIVGLILIVLGLRRPRQGRTSK